MSDAAIGYGSRFWIGDGASPEDFDSVAEVKTMSPPGFTMDEVDVTHLNSPGRYRETIGTIKDTTDVNMTANATAANLQQINAAADGLVRNFKITSNAEIGLEWLFSGFIKEMTPGELSNDDALNIEITVRCSGAPVLQPLSSPLGSP